MSIPTLSPTPSGIVLQCKSCQKVLTKTLMFVSDRLSVVPTTTIQQDEVQEQEADSSATLQIGTYTIVEESALGSTSYIKNGVEVVLPNERFYIVRNEDVVDEEIESFGNDNGCCGSDGLDGPNRSCTNCHMPVAIQTSDCWTAHETKFMFDVVEQVIRNKISV